MQISRGNARHFEICNLNFPFCPAEAGRFSQFFKGLNCSIDPFYPFKPDISQSGIGIVQEITFEIVLPKGFLYINKNGFPVRKKI